MREARRIDHLPSQSTHDPDSWELRVLSHHLLLLPSPEARLRLLYPTQERSVLTGWRVVEPQPGATAAQHALQLPRRKHHQKCLLWSCPGRVRYFLSRCSWTQAAESMLGPRVPSPANGRVRLSLQEMHSTSKLKIDLEEWQPQLLARRLEGEHQAAVQTAGAQEPPVQHGRSEEAMVWAAEQFSVGGCQERRGLVSSVLLV